MKRWSGEPGLNRVRDQAAQEERNRLARELHDSIKQQIFSINLGAAAAQARWENDPQGAKQALADVRRSAQEAMIEMEALLQQLSPVPLEKVGLQQALRDQGQALGYRTGAEVTVEFGDLPDDDQLPPGAQEDLFRIAQEGLSNVARHARARHVRLYLGQQTPNGPLVLEIHDDGQGFDTEAHPNGMGLDNIRQRAALLGGALELDSRPGMGTTLRVTVPLVPPPTPPNHSLNKTILIGLGGGLALMAMLFYPLYVLLPGRYIEGWPTGSGAPGLGLGIGAVLLAVAIGYGAARRVGVGGRQGSALFGAAAGAVAGGTLYFGLGGTAAAVAGHAPLWAFGLAPAGSESEAVRLLAEAAIGLVWGMYGTFWMALLVGAGLGALGGLLAPGGRLPSDRPDRRAIARRLLGAAGLSGALALYLALGLFGGLEVTLRRELAAHPVTLRTSLPVAGVSLLPIGGHLILWAGAMLALYAVLRSESRTADPPRLRTILSQAVEFCLLALTTFLICLLILWWVSLDAANLTPALRSLAPLLLIGSLFLGGLYLHLAVGLYRRRAFGPAFDLTPWIRIAVVGGTLLSLIALIWAAGSDTLFSMLVEAVVIAASAALVVLLWQRRTPPEGTAEQAHRQRSLSQTISAALGLVAAILLPLLPLIGTISTGISISLQWPPVLYDIATSTQPAPPIQMAQSAYATQALVAFMAFVGAAAIVGLLLAIGSGQVALARQHPDRGSGG